MSKGAPATASRLRLRVKPRAESIVRSGHPWLFSESIVDQNRAGQTGELAVIYDRQDRFLAVGLYDADSPLRVRILHVGKPAPVDRAWWSGRLTQAIAKRAGLFDSSTTGFRWINGESDGWPGLVLDRYDHTLVLKIYTSAWLPWLDQTLELVREQLRPERIVLRLSRNIREFAGRHYARKDGQVVHGPSLAGPVIFLESGLRFEADVLQGQKTGFFLDQRENRRRVGSLASGRRVLNAFSFSGGFSLYAARGGARSTTDLDISAHALAAAEQNFRLNGTIREVRCCERKGIQADAFEWLEQTQPSQFGLIILDPPSLAKRESERSGAVRAYAKLAALGLRHLAPGGILVACSCSAHVSETEFFAAVRKSAVQSRRRFQELETALNAADHPATFEEGRYLKAIYLQL